MLDYERLKFLRKTVLFKKQEEFCEAIEINQSAYSKIENGVTGITGNTIYKLKQAYPQVNTDWILTGKGEPLLTKINNINPTYLLKAIEHLRSNGYTDEVIAEKVHDHDIETYLHGVTPPEETIQNFEIFLGINGEYLRTGKGSITNSQFKTMNKGVPFYDIDVTAGNITNIDTTLETVSGYINVDWFRDCQMFVRVAGHSMYPDFCSGELIGIKQIDDINVIQYGEVYVVVTMDNQKMLKKIKKCTDNTMVTMVSKNKDYDPFDVPKEKIKALFMVKGKITNSAW